MPASRISPSTLRANAKRAISSPPLRPHADPPRDADRRHIRVLDSCYPNPGRMSRVPDTARRGPFGRKTVAEITGSGYLRAMPPSTPRTRPAVDDTLHLWVVLARAFRAIEAHAAADAARHG